MPGDPAQFAEAEAHGLPRRHRHGLLVHARGQAERIGKTQTTDHHRQLRHVKQPFHQPAGQGQSRGDGESGEGTVVDLLRVLREERRPGHVAVKPTHVGRVWQTGPVCVSFRA